MMNSQLYGISLNEFYCIDSMEVEMSKNSQDDLYPKLVTTYISIITRKVLSLSTYKFAANTEFMFNRTILPPQREGSIEGENLISRIIINNGVLSARGKNEG